MGTTLSGTCGSCGGLKEVKEYVVSITPEIKTVIICETCWQRRIKEQQEKLMKSVNTPTEKPQPQRDLESMAKRYAYLIDLVKELEEIEKFLVIKMDVDKLYRIDDKRMMLLKKNHYDNRTFIRILEIGELE